MARRVAASRGGRVVAIVDDDLGDLGVLTSSLEDAEAVPGGAVVVVGRSLR